MIPMEDEVQLLIEVVMDTPRSKSKVERTKATDARRRALVKEIAQMREEGIAPEIPTL